MRANVVIRPTERLQGMLALVFVTLIWGTTFPAVKALTVPFDALTIVLLRFALASVLLAPWLLQARRVELVWGILLGIPLFCSFLFQIEGLALTTANRNAFIYGLNALMVPLLGLTSGRALGRNVAVGMLLALVGIACLCWEGSAWGSGDNFALLGALSFAIYIRLMEARSGAGGRLMALTSVQIITVAMCAGICLLLREPVGTNFHSGQTAGRQWYLVA